MEDMVKKIIEMDEHARKISSSAQEEAKNSINEIQKAKDEIHEKYYARAKRRLKLNKQAQQEKTDLAIKEIEKNYRKLMKQMEQTYKENKQQWIEEIFKRTIEE